MDTFVAFCIAAVITLFFVRGYLKQLTAKQRGSAGSAAPRTKVAQLPCPRCAQPMTQGAAFCSFCGAALAMWTVQQAAVAKSAVNAQLGRATPVINASLCVGCSSCIEACPESGALEMVSGKAILAHPDLCTGHAKCAEACPTNGITYAFGGVLQTVRVPHVNSDFQTNIPGIFIVGELGGMGLIKSAIHEGKLAMDRVQSLLQQQEGTLPPTPAAVPADATYDVAIIGAGPAGLSASLTAQQHELHYLTLEQGEIAATIRNYPRHKFLMAEPLTMPLYGDLYLADGTKESLLSVREAIVQNTGVRIKTNERLERVVRNGAGFHIESTKGHYYARYVVLALGRRGTPRRLGIAGENLGKVAYRLIEAESYRGKNILVLGGGDSALEAALAVGNNGANRVIVSYRGTDFSRARERNRNFLRAAEQAGTIRVLYNSTLQAITPTAVRLATAVGDEELPNDFVFILIGGESPEGFLVKTGIEIVEKSLQPSVQFQ